MGTTSRRSNRKNWYKRRTPRNTLVRNRSIIGGTKVPGIGAPKIQLAKRSSTAWHTTLAVRAKAIAGGIGLQCMRTPTVCLYPWTTAGAHLVNYHQSLQVYLPRRSHLGSHMQIRVRRRESPQVVESVDTPAPLTPCVHEPTHPVQFGIMPKRLPLPHLDDEILSAYEEDLSSIQDGFTACVMADTESTLERHLLRKGGAKSINPDSHDRRHC